MKIKTKQLTVSVIILTLLSPLIASEWLFSYCKLFDEVNNLYRPLQLYRYEAHSTSYKWKKKYDFDVSKWHKSDTVGTDANGHSVAAELNTITIHGVRKICTIDIGQTDKNGNRLPQECVTADSMGTTDIGMIGMWPAGSVGKYYWVDNIIHKKPLDKNSLGEHMIGTAIPWVNDYANIYCFFSRIPILMPYPKEFNAMNEAKAKRKAGNEEQILNGEDRAKRDNKMTVEDRINRRQQIQANRESKGYMQYENQTLKKPKLDSESNMMDSRQNNNLVNPHQNEMSMNQNDFKQENMNRSEIDRSKENYLMMQEPPYQKRKEPRPINIIQIEGMTKKDLQNFQKPPQKRKPKINIIKYNVSKRKKKRDLRIIR